MSTRLADRRREALARALGRGAPLKEAAAEAGYRCLRAEHLRRAAGRQEVKDRAAHWARIHPWGGDELLADAFDELIRLAKEAGDQKTAAGSREARGLMAEAARLRLAARRETVGAAPETGPRVPMPPRLSTEEWIKKHGRQT